MKALALFLIGLATPPAQREWVVGDTRETFDRRAHDQGGASARWWLWREATRVAAQAPRAYFFARRGRRGSNRSQGDGMWFTVSRDLRYAARLLWRAPGFTAVVVATLALGIGANTAMFAVVNGVLLKPLPFRQAERLMLIHMLFPDREAGPGLYREGAWSYAKYRTFADLQQPFADTALFAARDFSIAGDGEPERVRAEIVTDRYTHILGIVPVIGRAFTGAEAHRAGTPAVALIGHGLWQRRYGGEANVLGRTLRINGSPYAIVGVLPPGFSGLSGNAELWTPLAVTEPSALDQAQSHSYTVVAMRKADVAEETATAAVRVYGPRVQAAHHTPAMPAEVGSGTAVSLSASRADADVRRAAWVVLGAVGCVLLIACVNLTNLLLARAIGRRREVAIRLAIGASRGRVASQFMVESLLLAGLGALGGLVVAVLLLAAAAALLPDSDVFFRTAMAPGARRMAGAPGLTRIGAGMIGLDAITLLFTLGVTVVTAGLVALWPAIQVSSRPPLDVLKSAGSSGTARGLHVFGARAALVAAQMALALVLLTGAGLMVKSAARLHATGIGVTADRVLSVRVDLPSASYTRETGTAFFSGLAARVRAMPGVDSVGLGNCPPVSGGCNSTSFWFPDKPRRGQGEDPLVGVHWITPEQLTTLGIRLVRGRTFSDRDRAGQPKVVLVNEAAARAHWPNGNPIGQRIAIGQGNFHDGAEVVGVVADVRYRTIETAAIPDVYVPFLQSYQSRMRLFVRSRVDPSGLGPAIAREVRALDPNLPLSEVKMMDERIADAMWRTRVGAWLLSAFAGLALLLTTIGVFGVMAQTVQQRTPEIGIRLALGAQRRDVLSLVLGQGALITVGGLVLGVGCALGLTRLIGSLLYDVEPTDPATLAVVVAVLAAVALAACYVPARRATRVEAVVALKSE